MSVREDLPWFIREYMYDRGWSFLRDIQERTLDLISRGDCNVLLSAGTSGGKTEAAVFPVIASIYRDRPRGIGAVYIGPLKALIDDQNGRLNEILKLSEIRVTAWHGDIDSRRKNDIRSNPSGILQITPESLQGIVAFHPEDLKAMFGDLRFVIVDEVHAFLGSDRGLQLLCVLYMISRMTGCRPRVIGLSATLSDMEAAKAWVSSINGMRTEEVRDDRVLEHTIAVRFYHFPEDEGDDRRRDAVARYYDAIFRETDPYNCIVFTNSRMKAENTKRSLMSYSSYVGSSKRIAIHHGSVSKEIRKDSEVKLRSSDYNTTLIATTTMELGIDVGDVDRVIQIEPPYSSSSFVQRMGRSGRRTGHPVMVLFCTDDEGRPFDHPMEFSLSLMMGLAMINLYERDHWVEPIHPGNRPYGLLFQQILIMAASLNGVREDELKAIVRGMYPFRGVSEGDLDCLLAHMKSSDYLYEIPDEGVLVVGDSGERLMSPQRILAVFEDDNEYEAVYGDKKIGYLPKQLGVGGKVMLGGRAWTIKSIAGKKVSIVPTPGDAVTRWNSGIPNVHTAVVREMRNVLFGDDCFEGLGHQARARLISDREIIRSTVPRDRTFVKEGDDITIYPWLGTVQFDTLMRILKKIPEANVLKAVPMLRIVIETTMSIEELHGRIESIRTTIKPVELMEKDDRLVRGKFDPYVPKSLLIKRFTDEMIDLSFDLCLPNISNSELTVK